MLTKLEHQLLEFFFCINSWTQTFPFSWNQNGFARLTTNRTNWQKLGGTLNISWYGAELAYVFIRLVPGFGYTPEEFQSLHYAVIMNAVIVLWLTNAFATQLGALYKSDELASLGNQLLSFNRIYGKIYANGEYAAPNLREKLLCGFIVYCFVLGSCSMPVLMAMAPENKYTLYSALPPNWQTPTALVLTLAIEVCTWAKIVVLHFFLIYIGFAYISANLFWLNKICLDWIPSRHAHIQRRALEVYRSLTILNTIYNNGCASILIPILKTALEIGAMSSLYAITRLHHSVNIFVMTFFVGSMLVCLFETIGSVTFMAKVNEKSVEFQQCFKQCIRIRGVSGRCDRKLMASYRPLVCRISTFFFVEKETKLIYMSLLLNVFIHVLLGTSRGSRLQ